jgi:hypothetical protein
LINLLRKRKQNYFGILFIFLARNSPLEQFQVGVLLKIAVLVPGRGLVEHLPNLSIADTDVVPGQG